MCAKLPIQIPLSLSLSPLHPQDTVKIKQQPPASPDGLIAALTGQTMDIKKQQVSNGKSSNVTTGSKQQHSSSSGGLSTTPTTGGRNSSGGGGSGSHMGECPEGGASASGASSLQRQSSNGRLSKQGQHNNSMSLNLSLSNGTTGVRSSSSKLSRNCLSNGVDAAKVFIKKEPDSFESGSQNRHCNRSPTTATSSSASSGRRLSLNGKDSKRSQRMSTSQKPSSDKLMRSFSMSDDLEDDLKLSAADCMGGVISTPPIKPLEEGDDMITTPSPPTSAGVLKSGGSSRSGSAAVENTNNSSGASTASHVTASSTTSAGRVTSPHTSSVSQAEMNKKVGMVPSSANVKDNSSLMQELDDFSRILDEVAMEQRANEERFVLNRPPNVFHRPAPHAQQQSHDMVATAHVPRPTHLISPPPYYAATAAPKPPGPSQQQYYNHPAGQPPPSYATTPHGPSSVQDPSLYIGVDYQQSLSQQHMTPTQVDPTTFAPRPDQLHSQQQRHPQLQHISASAVSPQVHQQPPSLGGGGGGQSRSVLVSPTVRGMPLPHTPISSHLPPFPDPAVSSVTTPTMPPPHTPTTPLEHFNNTFPAAPPPTQQQQQPPHPTPPSQLHSPTHPQYVPAGAPPPQAGTVPMSSTAFPFNSSHLRSPTVTSAGFNWQPNAPANSSLRDQMLAQVASHIEARIGGQKRLSQDAGFSIPPPTKMVAATAGPSPYPPQISHMTLRPQTPAQQQQQQQQQSQQYLPSGAPPTAPPTGSSIAAASVYTGLSQQQQQLVHTISYQGQGRMTSAPAYPHHHI